ncbi:MAG: carbon storage regulator CsrA [Gammaproteobacteria bacterium]|jgi:carbon storage regulator
MLILSRKIGEAIVIGEDVKLVILGFRGNQIRVGIEAPKSIGVNREEIWLRIKDKQKKLMDSIR